MKLITKQNKNTKIQKCSESNSGRPKIWSTSGQNDPGTIIIEFALKNYAQKWSQIVKTLDGCPQNVDFGIFVRPLRTLVRMSIFPLGPGVIPPPIRQYASGNESYFEA